MVDWGAFLLVLVVALVGAGVVVGAYSLGLRLLTVAGRVPVVTPIQFTDAITIMTPSEIKAAEKRAKKSAKKNPLTENQKRMAHIGAWVCFGLSMVAVLIGIWLIVGDHLMKIFSA